MCSGQCLGFVHSCSCQFILFHTLLWLKDTFRKTFLTVLETIPHTWQIQAAMSLIEKYTGLT